MIRQSGITLDQQIRRLSGASKEFKGMITDGLQEVEPIVEDMMLDLSSQKKNNITHEMVSALGAETAKTGTQLRFGFIRSSELYMRLQTISGFKHSNGSFIKPSLAIADARVLAEPLMIAAAKRIRRNFMARLRSR